MLFPTVFLDRDGVLIRQITERGRRETPRSPEEVKVLEGVVEGLVRLKQAGYRLVVVTNQPDVAKGKVTFEVLKEVEERFRLLLGPLVLDGYYACVHHNDPNQVVVPELLCDCDCRKPRPGLILKAAEELAVDLSKSWLVGDHETDIHAGKAGGIPTNQLILIGRAAQDVSYRVAANFVAAADIILEKR